MRDSASTACALLHVNDAKTPLGSNRDRHDVVARGLLGDGLATFLGHPALRGLPAILETWPENGLSTADIDLLRDLRRRGCAVGVDEVTSAGLDRVASAFGCASSRARRATQSATVAKTRKVARSRGSSWNSGIAAPEVVLAVRVRPDDLDLAHRERRATGANGAEAATTRSRPPRAARDRSRRRRSSACTRRTCGPRPRTRRRTGRPSGGRRPGRRPSRSGRRSGGTPPRPGSGAGARPLPLLLPRPDCVHPASPSARLDKRRVFRQWRQPVAGRGSPERRR